MSFKTPRLLSLGALGALLATLALSAATLTQLESDKLLPDDGAPFDLFGQSAAIEGDTAVIGASGDGTKPGSAYVFTRSGTIWAQQKLTASDGEGDDSFGRDVALSGDTLVIGAPKDDDRGTASGSAYVFVRSGTTWSEQAKLHAFDGARLDGFGTSASVDGDLVVIGAPAADIAGHVNSGAAYIFRRNGTGWVLEAWLTPSDRAALDFFGVSVSLDGDTVVIGADDDDDNGSRSGSAYVFTLSGGSWRQQAKLTASDGAPGDQFGTEVALDADTAIVSAHDDGAASGSAYVYTRSGTSWSQQAKLLASDSSRGDFFGSSVATDGDLAVVGAEGDDISGTVNAGSAYVFVRSGSSWSEQAKLIASDGGSFDNLGSSGAVDGGTVVLGAKQDRDNGLLSGSAYVFDLGISVVIDIKPGSDSNSINLSSNGKIPVAVLTTDTFDATQIDPLTVSFGPAGAGEAHGRAHVVDIDADGDADLVLHFNRQDTGIACGDTEAALTGQTFSGQAVTGSDTLRAVKCD